MKKSIFHLMTYIALLSFAGCSDDELPVAPGIVVYTGNFSSGGCEWMIDIYNELYQPKNLPVQFQVDSMHVMVTYRILSRDTECPNSQNHAGIININQINPI